MDYKFINTWSEFTLNETLKTHDIDITFRNVNSELSLLRYNFKITKISNTLIIELLNFRYINGVGIYLDNLNNLMIDRHGWFPSKMNILNTSGMSNEFPYNEEMLRDINRNNYYQSVEITYESKYDTELVIPIRLYHLSIQEYDNHISKYGLVPKSKLKLSNHLDRIYVCVDKSGCYNLIRRVNFLYYQIKSNNSKNNINYKWVIYEIDSSSLNFKLYKDPNYNGGYYILDNIKPDILKVIDREK